MSKQRTLQRIHEVYSISPYAFGMTLGPLFCLSLQSNHLARGPKLPNRAFLSVSEGPCRDAQLESLARERSGESLVTLVENNACVRACSVEALESSKIHVPEAIQCL
jgi:hypothetical protein